jgi:hypothetical protein
MAVLVFPDNTALINFAIINRMDLLSRLANGNGRWCATVSIECARSARVPGLAALDDAPEIFGEPLFPDDAELQDVRVLRDELASPGDQPSKHLGEAETLAIVARRHLNCFFWGYVQTLQGRSRGAPRGVSDRLSFDKWLAT